MNQPNKGPLSELSEDDFDFFIKKLGWLVFNTIGAAALARHRSPLNTVQDYLDHSPEDDLPMKLAKEYWRDLASKKLQTHELCKKWFLSNRSELGAIVAKGLADNLK